jgi:hypothetical protein
LAGALAIMTQAQRLILSFICITTKWPGSAAK